MKRLRLISLLLSATLSVPSVQAQQDIEEDLPINYKIDTQAPLFAFIKGHLKGVKPFHEIIGAGHFGYSYDIPARLSGAPVLLRYFPRVTITDHNESAQDEGLFVLDPMGIKVTHQLIRVQDRVVLAPFPPPSHVTVKAPVIALEKTAGAVSVTPSGVFLDMPFGLQAAQSHTLGILLTASSGANALGSAGTLTLARATGFLGPLKDSEISYWIGALGSEKFLTRELASKTLTHIGRPAIGRVVKALNSKDPEVRRRAEWIEKDIYDKNWQDFPESAHRYAQNLRQSLRRVGHELYETKKLTPGLREKFLALVAQSDQIPAQTGLSPRELNYHRETRLIWGPYIHFSHGMYGVSEIVPTRAYQAMKMPLNTINFLGEAPSATRLYFARALINAGETKEGIRYLIETMNKDPEIITNINFKESARKARAFEDKDFGKALDAMKNREQVAYFLWMVSW